MLLIAYTNIPFLKDDISQQKQLLYLSVVTHELKGNRNNKTDFPDEVKLL